MQESLKLSARAKTLIKRKSKDQKIKKRYRNLRYRFFAYFDLIAKGVKEIFKRICGGFALLG